LYHMFFNAGLTVSTDFTKEIVDYSLINLLVVPNQFSVLFCSVLLHTTDDLIKLWKNQRHTASFPIESIFHHFHIFNSLFSLVSTMDKFTYQI
jgi:hypothetical protein